MRVLLVGFGNVGRRLAEILSHRAGYPGLSQLDIIVVGIMTGSRGCLADPRGVDLVAALETMAAHDRFLPSTPGLVLVDTDHAVHDLEYDVLVETSPLDVRRRGEPALGRCRAALQRGRHVVTCNKGPVAWGYRELAALAHRRGAEFRFESTVMDGVPVFNLVRNCLPGTEVTAIEGVLNSTTNVVLEAIEHGLSLADGVEEARRLGIAEADPSFDLDGWDAAVKLSALANVLLGVDLEPERVARTRVDELIAPHILAEHRAGRTTKLICRAAVSGDHVEASVTAESLAPGHPFAVIRGASSILRLTTDLAGTITILEENPTVTTTAYGVLADLVSVAHR